jgi:hypothetical protein
MPVQTFTTLNDPLAPSGTQPVGINAAGDIVGIYVTATGVDGFLLSGGTYTTIADPLGHPTCHPGPRHQRRRPDRRVLRERQR